MDLETFREICLDQLARFGKIEEHVDVDLDETSGFLMFYTDNNAYRIRIDTQSDYLGCVASSRKPRAGEDWHRGNDLHDGNCSHETWQRILADIVSYEMVKIHKAPADAGPKELYRED